MPRRSPPPGYITPAQAQELLGSMLYKYVKRGVLQRYTPPYGSYGYYKLSEVEELKRSQEVFYEVGPQEEAGSNGESGQEQHHIEFALATPADMEGVYAVAVALFGHTTSAEARKPLVALCPEGNYIVRDNGQIMAYIHIQPLKPDRMKAFLDGEIRGSQIRADDLECFTPGKPTDVLIKSVGAIGQGKWPKHYIQRLVTGAARDLGNRGINLARIYATSETETGIAMSIHAEMTSLGKIGKSRYAFMLDVASSNLPMLQIYKRAYAEWQTTHAPPPAPATPRQKEPKQPQINPVSSAVRSLASTDTTENTTLPVGHRGFTEFFRSHGIAETTAGRAAEHGVFQILTDGWKQNGRPVRKALDPDGQNAFIRHFRQRPGYHMCEVGDCVCREYGYGGHLGDESE